MYSDFFNQSKNLLKKGEDFFVKEFESHIHKEELKITENLLKNRKSEGNISHNNLKSIDRVKELLRQTKQKLKLETLNKEKKFFNSMKPFHSLDTFIDIRKFLKNMNLTTNGDLSCFLKKINHRLEKDQFGNYFFLKNDFENINEIEFIENTNFDQLQHFKNKIKIMKEKNNNFYIEKNSNKNKPINKLIGDYLLTNEIKNKDEISNFQKNMIEMLKQEQITSEIQDNIQNFKDNDRLKRELDQINNFLHSSPNQAEKEFNEGILKGFYLKAFRNQSEKIAKLLEKTSKNIYQKKLCKINEKNNHLFLDSVNMLNSISSIKKQKSLSPIKKYFNFIPSTLKSSRHLKNNSESTVNQNLQHKFNDKIKINNNQNIINKKNFNYNLGKLLKKIEFEHDQNKKDFLKNKIEFQKLKNQTNSKLIEIFQPGFESLKFEKKDLELIQNKKPFFGKKLFIKNKFF